VELETTELRFSRGTYHIPQAVRVLVRVQAQYQGSVGITFFHDVDTLDVLWASPFLLPVSLTLIDDDACVDGAAQEDVQVVQDNRRVRVCQCTPGFFVDGVDEAYCNSVTRCVRCEVNPKP
jgi:hypothetical protein